MSVTIDGTNGVTASASFYGQSTFTGTYTDGIVVDYTTGTGRITVGSSDGLKIRNGGTASPTDLVTVDSSGNVGIGTSSPTAKLNISGTSAGAAFDLTNTTASTGKRYRIVSGDNGNMYFTDMTASADRVTIDSSGNLLVGKTSSNAANTGAELQSGAGGNAAVIGTADGQFALLLNRLTSNGSIADFRRSGTSVGSVSVTTTATTYNTSSDYRLKDITGPVTGAKEFIMALQPKQGTWKLDGSRFVGFVAHEFQEVSPLSVTGEKDAVDENGEPIYQAMQASSPEVIANLVSLLQEQQAIIQQLQADVAALKAA